MSLHRRCWPRGAQRILHMASLPRAAVVQCSLVSIVRLIKDVLSRLLSLNQKWWMLIKWLRMEKKIFTRHIRDFFLGSARCNTTQTYRHPLDGIFYLKKEERQGWRHSFKFPIYISEHMVIFTFLDFLLKRTCKVGGDVINLCQFIQRENLLEKMPYLVVIDPPKSHI